MFAGLISKEQPVEAWGNPEHILSALAPYNADAPRDVWRDPRLCLMQVATRTGATTAAIYRHSESGLAVAFWGRLDNRSDLQAQLGAGQDAVNEELLALAWLKWGEYAAEQLVGDFALAIACARNGTVYLARDVMGVKPLFYRIDAHGVFFANSAAAFKVLQLGNLSPDPDWMARFIIDLSYHHSETAYREVKKLPGAHSLLLHADGRSSLRRYHRFVDDAPVERRRDPKWLDAYQAIWREAVACRMPVDGMIGTENSGGLDSGSVTSEIARQLGDEKGMQRLFALGFAYDELEPEHIMAVARHCRIPNTYLVAGLEAKPSEGWIEQELRIAGYPNEHPNGTSHTAFYRECRLHGIGTLFSGFGGDECITLNGWALRRELFNRRDWRGLWDILPGALPARAARFGLTAWRGMQPLPRLHKALKAETDANWPNLLLRSDVTTRLNLYQKRVTLVSESAQFDSVNAHALNELSHAYVATRMGNCTLMAAAFGVDYVWPMLDHRLLQQWLSTPSIWKLGPHGKTRYLHRRAVAEAGPDKMVWIRSKDMGNAQSLAYWAERDNTPIFQRMLALANALPEPLATLVDVDKMRETAEQGIRLRLKGAKINYLNETVTGNLESLKHWLTR